MAEVTCQNCQCRFDSANHPVVEGVAAAGALTGAVLGARLGMVAGPVGAISGAVIGGLLADAGISKVTKCPCCDEVFWL
jgi:phage tail tape-measure protein